ncbi:unnamed protein product [Anisakis simplex]|uniref:Protein lap1 n=1 Tax=Anisakis simplex TaxID=6269 RepID=A0A0M3JYG6_ANISI|nr:unnamed protein product [Anisakis simplex]
MPIFSCIPFACSGHVDVIEKRQCNLHDLPIEVERCANSLEELYLDCNQISDITEGLCRCKKLKCLSLGQNKILRVPPSIGSLTALEELHLEDNELSDLPEELVKCCDLRILDLRLNLLTRLPEVISKLSSLTHLYLFETSLTQLPPDIDKLKNLRSLDVRENQLRALPPALCQLKQLRELDLGRNELSHLPLNLGSLENLEDLYVDHNLLSSLPDSLTSCDKLRVLDVSQNDLCSLPKQIGDLKLLDELNIAENRIAQLPETIGSLKKLTFLKADSNALTELSPAIGDCHSLSEIYLFNNQLTTLPSSLGNLKELSVLSVAENQLEEIPSTIGGCTKVSILTLRGNRLRQLPIEIGRLANLRVLDLCDNILQFLPFTINVLFNLRALWLSVDQTSPLVPFESVQDPGTHVKVLTSYLLPQGKCEEEAGIVTHQRRTTSGVNVRFGSEEGDVSGEDESVGHFERKGTPHPKTRSRAVTPRRQSIDGHFIPHNQTENTADLTLSLRRKSAGDMPNAEGSIQKSSNQANGTSAERSGANSLAPISESDEKMNVNQLPDLIANNDSFRSECRIMVRRDERIGFGLSITGGIECEPYKADDNGLFVSGVVANGPSQSSGLMVGDKILSVNGHSVVDQSHYTVAEMMQKVDQVELLIQREQQPSTSSSHLGNDDVKKEGTNEESVDENKNPNETTTCEQLISTTIQRDLNGSLGFEVDADKGNLVVKSIISPSDTLKQSPIQVGDHLLSINGKTLTGSHLDVVKELMSDENSNEVYVVVRRQQSSSKDRGFVTKSDCSLISSVSETPTEGAFTTDTQTDQSFGMDDNAEQTITADISTVRVEVRSSEEVASEAIHTQEARDQCSSINANIQQSNATSDQVLNQQVVNNTSEPEKMTILSKIKKFESVSQVPELEPQGDEQQPLPAKKPLVSAADIEKMKEEENKKLANSFSMDVDEYSNTDFSFEHLLSNNALPNSSPAIVRIKEAAHRLITANGHGEEAVDGVSITAASDKSTMKFDEMQKRQMWRQARYESLEKDTVEAERLMEQVLDITARYGNISEEESERQSSMNVSSEENELHSTDSNLVDDENDAAAVILKTTTTVGSPYQQPLIPL